MYNHITNTNREVPNQCLTWSKYPARTGYFFSLIFRFQGSSLKLDGIMSRKPFTPGVTILGFRGSQIEN